MNSNVGPMTQQLPAPQNESWAAIQKGPVAELLGSAAPSFRVTAEFGDGSNNPEQVKLWKHARSQICVVIGDDAGDLCMLAPKEIHRKFKTSYKICAMGFYFVII